MLWDVPEIRLPDVSQYKEGQYYSCLQRKPGCTKAMNLCHLFLISIQQVVVICQYFFQENAFAY